MLGMILEMLGMLLHDLTGVWTELVCDRAGSEERWPLKTANWSGNAAPAGANPDCEWVAFTCNSMEANHPDESVGCIGEQSAMGSLGDVAAGASTARSLQRAINSRANRGSRLRGQHSQASPAKGAAG